MKPTQKLAIFLLLVVLAMVLAVTFLRENNTSQAGSFQSSSTASVKTLWGISGFVPANYPDSSPKDLTDYWQEIKTYAQIYGVHTDWQDTKFLETASKLQPHPISLVLGFQNPEDWKDSERVQELEDKIVDLLTKYPQIKYLAIGNEMNLVYEKHKEEFSNFVALYINIYKDLKPKYPDINFSVTFNYETLIGKGYLTGQQAGRQNNLKLISSLEPYLDIVSLTVYPFLDIADVSTLGNDYFAPLSKITSKKILITETGWPTMEDYGDALKVLQAQGYTGSEEEQQVYLNWLENIQTPETFAGICWAFMNDLVDWQEGSNASFPILYQSIGLKYNSGTGKLAWLKWQSIVDPSGL